MKRQHAVLTPALSLSLRAPFFSLRQRSPPPPCVIRDANMGHQSAAGNVS